MNLTIGVEDVNKEYFEFIEEQGKYAVEHFLKERDLTMSELEMPRLLNPNEVHTGKQISHHANRSIFINGEKKFHASVYIDKHDKTKVIKVYAYNETDDVLAIIFAYEVHMQRKAYKVSNECGVQVPQIYDFGVYHAENKTFFVIIMDRIEYENISKRKQTCKNIMDKVNYANDCLLRNNISHNDLHPENIFASNDSSKFAFIDFGTATPVSIENFKHPFSCETIKSGGKTHAKKTRRKSNRKSNRNNKSNKRRKN